MKIKKYQAGGIYYTPYFRETTSQVVSQNAQPEKETTSKEDNLIQKEIIQVLKENGLPNDVDYFLSSANTFLKKSQNVGYSLGESKNDSYDMSNLIRVISLANRVKHNKELHEDASKQIISQGSGSDVAISDTGNLYVINDKKDITTISPNEYYKNSNDYQILTNSELLHLRENLPQLTYKSGILSDLANTVGMKSIVDYVKSTISAFGTNEASNKFEKYTIKNKDKIEKGFEQLLGLESPDGVYKASIEQSSSNQGYNDQESLELAVNYLYNTLQPNMKNVLRANAAAEGLNPNNVKDVQRLLTLAVLEHTNHSITNQQSLNYDNTTSKTYGFGDNSKSDKQRPESRLEMVAADTPSKSINILIGGNQSRSGFIISAQPVGKFQNNSGKQLGMDTIGNILLNDEIGHIVDNSSISFGNKHLSETDLNRVVYDGTSTIHRTWLPIDQEEYNTTGKIMPDLDALRRFEIFKKWLDEGNGVLPNAINQKITELNLNIERNPNNNQWQFKKEDSHLFLIANGYLENDAVSFNTNSQWMQEVDDSNIYNKYMDIMEENGYDRWRWTDREEMKKSIIFMPVLDPRIATIVSGHQYAPQDRFVDIYNRDAVSDQIQNTRTNF